MTEWIHRNIRKQIFTCLIKYGIKMLHNKYEYRRHLGTICVSVVFILILAFLLRGLDFTKMWAYGDYAGFDIKDVYERVFYVWNTENLGFLQFFGLNFVVPLALSTITGALLAQKILVVFPFIVSYFACFYFLRSFKFSVVPAFLASFFYAINPITISAFIGGGIGQLITFAIFPLFSLYFYRLLSENKFSLKYTTILGLLTLFLLNSFMGITYAIFILFPYCLLYFVYKKNAGRIFRLIPLFIIISLIFLPTTIVGRMIESSLSTSNLPIKHSISFRGDAAYTYQDASLVNLLRLAGNTGTAQQEEGLDYNTHNNYTVFGLVLSLLAVCSLLFIRKAKGEPYFILLISASISFIIIIGIGLLIKTYPDFVDLNIVFSTLRNPEKLMYPLCFSFIVLFAYGTQTLGDKLSQKSKLLEYTTFGIVSIMVFLYNIPALDGTLGLEKIRDNRYVIEEKYENLPGILQNIDKDYDKFRFVLLPWQYGVNIKIRDKLPNYFGTNLGAQIYGTNIAGVKDVFDSISSNSENKSQILSLFNVKYVIIDNTFDEQSSQPIRDLVRLYRVAVYQDSNSYWITGKPSYFSSIFDNDPHFALVYRDKNFSIFRNNLTSGNIFQLPPDKEYTLRYVYYNTTGDNLVRNPSFMYKLKDWERWPQQLVSINKNGSYSAELQGQEKYWTNIYQFIKVKENASYQLQFFVKAYNITNLHAKILWYNQTEKIGDNDYFTVDYLNLYSQKDLTEGHWYKINHVFPSPTGAKLARVMFLAGKLGNFSNSASLFDNISFYQVSPKALGLPNIYKSDFVSYERVSPTLYKLRTNTSTPYILALDQSYDKSWEAEIYKEGKKVTVSRPFNLYGMINGFYINQTGNLNIIIENKAQGWFDISLLIYWSTYGFCIIYLLLTIIKDRQHRWLAFISVFESKIRALIPIRLRLLKVTSQVAEPTGPYVVNKSTEIVSPRNATIWYIAPHLLILVSILVTHFVIYEYQLIFFVIYALLIPLYIFLKFDGNIPIAYALGILTLQTVIGFYKTESFVNQLFIYWLLIVGIISNAMRLLPSRGFKNKKLGVLAQSGG